LSSYFCVFLLFLCFCCDQFHVHVSWTCEM
jgi:hypothetical protein